MSDKLPKDVIEFQTDALEIRNSRLPWGIRLCVWFPLFIVIGAIVWAFLTEVDVVVQCSGTLVTDEQTIVMKPLERTVIKDVNVKIGDIVKKDQILIVFDPTINQAEAQRLKNEIFAQKAELERLMAEFNSKPFIAGNGQFEEWQKTIYQQRQDYYQERMNYFNSSASQLEASQKTRSDSLVKQKERLEAVKHLEQIYTKLNETGAAPLKELIEMSISRMEMENTVDQLENEILEMKHRRESIDAEKNSFIQQWRNSIAEDMVKVDRNLTSTQKEYDKMALLMSMVCLRAPCDAVVHEIASFSEGSAVREAEALITLVPLGERIDLEAELQPRDIARVQTGANTRVKLTAYPFQKYGTLNGIVKNISENTLVKENTGMRQPYYRVRVALGGRLTGVQDTFRLIPGMEAQCEIKCGRRRVIEYIIYPLIKAFDETAREP